MQSLGYPITSRDKLLYLGLYSPTIRGHLMPYLEFQFSYNLVMISYQIQSFHDPIISRDMLSYLGLRESTIRGDVF